ncbi:hypothetical protein EVAR_60505_1 [Eumeta japonica]|uniref:Uncharacterized protein n=1 Tax=Eumeta variegata TaxID=151549 RepID=A0A4C1ZM95_EUMVA|nr:hypothetical protein EVAR_60505_1 [Eumeta japonica]
MDVKRNNISYRHYRLLVLVNEIDECRTQHEQLLLQVQTLQEVLHIFKIKTDKLQCEPNLCRVNETVRNSNDKEWTKATRLFTGLFHTSIVWYLFWLCMIEKDCTQVSCSFLLKKKLPSE